MYAKDAGIPPNFAKAKVHITVQDENDNAPAFGREHYSLEVPENLEPVELFTLKATDQDTGESGRLKYKITGHFVCVLSNIVLLFEILHLKIYI